MTDPMALARVMMGLSDDDKLVALAWLERVVASGDDIDKGLLANVLNGSMTIHVVAGEIQFALSEAGRKHVGELLLNDPEAQRMLASLRDSTRVDEPKDPQ